MAIMRLVLRDSCGAELVVPIRSDIADELFLRMSQALSKVGAKRLGELSAYGLLGTIGTVVQPDPRPPTPAQIKFALDIATQLGIELPEGVLQDRSVMGGFLTQYGDRLRRHARFAPGEHGRDG